MSDQTILNEKQQHKLNVITSTLKKQITNEQAAKTLNISIRQVQRLKIAIVKQGAKGLVHKLTDRKSNHSINQKIKEQVLKKIAETYADFKPKFATEKLQEHEKLNITSQTIRVWMTEVGLWKTRKQKKTGDYRTWRPRKEYFGESLAATLVRDRLRTLFGNQSMWRRGLGVFSQTSGG